MSGRADVILENLIVDGKTRLMIMVMMKGLTDGTWAGGSSPEGIGNYRVLEGKEYRAIAGLSMGGGSLLSLACGIPGNFAEWGTFVPDC